MDTMQTFSNHDSLLNVFEMDDIDPIDIFEDSRSKSASMLADMPTKPSRFSTPDTQEDEMAQLRRESATEKEPLDLGITSSSMIETVKSENEMLVSTPRIEVRITSFFRTASQKHLPSLAFVRVFICDMCCTKASFYRLCTRLKALYCSFLILIHSHNIYNTHVLFFHNY